MKYTTEMIESIAVKLREMPAADKKRRELSKQEAVRLLVKEITALQRRGYTLDEIAETLRGEGLDILTPTLKSYLQRARSSKGKKVAAPKVKETPAVPNRSIGKSMATFHETPDSRDI